MRDFFVRISAGLGDAFLCMAHQVPHRCIQDIKKKHPDVKIQVNVLSNNMDLMELYKHNPNIHLQRHVSHTTAFLKPLELKSIIYNSMEHPVAWDTEIDFSTYEQAGPVFYLTPEEQALKQTITKDRYLFLHLYSSTPNKRLPIDFAGLVDYIIDELRYNVVFFGKSHEFDAHSHARGWPSQVEVLNYTRPGLYNFTTDYLPLNNPRLGWHLVEDAHYCLLSESAYLQAATLLDKKMITIVGPGLLQSYLNDLGRKSPEGFKYFTGMIKSTNRIYDVATCDLKAAVKGYNDWISGLPNT